VRLQSLVQYHRAMDSFAKTIRCLPPLEELQTNHPDIYTRVMNLTLSGVQYQLCGEGCGDPLPRYTRQPKRTFCITLKCGLFDSLN
jgi:hypothetical protein